MADEKENSAVKSETTSRDEGTLVEENPRKDICDDPVVEGLPVKEDKNKSPEAEGKKEKEDPKLTAEENATGKGNDEQNAKMEGAKKIQEVEDTQELSKTEESSTSKGDVEMKSKVDAATEDKDDALIEGRVVPTEQKSPATSLIKEVTDSGTTIDTTIEVEGVEDEDTEMEKGGEEKNEVAEPSHVGSSMKSRQETEIGKEVKNKLGEPYKIESPIQSRKLEHSASSRKRERKAASMFQPENFKEERRKSGDVSILPGKGTKLRDIPKVKANIDKLAAKDPVLAASHKLLYSGTGRRGTVAKKVVKRQVLEFSGFVPAQKKLLKNNDELLDKFEAKARKMVVPLLKSICDLFDVDRRPLPGDKIVLDKESLVNRLLDFLVAPHIKLTNNAKKSSRKRVGGAVVKVAKRARKSRPKVEKVEEEEDVMEDDDEDNGEIPSKKQLQKFVRAYVTCFSMDKTTTKHLIQTASDKFDVDLSNKKKEILELLTAEIPSV